MYCRQTSDIQPVLSYRKPRYLQRCTAMFTQENSTLLPWLVDNMEVGLPTQRKATYGVIHQRICFSISNHCNATCALLSIYNLVTFLTPMTIMSLERPSVFWHCGHSDSHDKTALQDSKKFYPGLLQRLPATLEAVYWCRKKLLHRRYLAPKYKYTTLKTFQTQVVVAAVAVSVVSEAAVVAIV